MSSAPSEFQIIQRYFEGVGEYDSELVELGIGDDCAVLSPPSNKSLCFSLDTMVEGRHFPKFAPPEKLAKRAMAAALSDLAAMGAVPSFFTLSLTLPKADQVWLEGFSKGLKYMAERYQVSLLGGDTTRGPLTIGIQVHGFVEQGRALRRSGAKQGDVLVVTGSLGDAGAALELLGRELVNDAQNYLLDRYYSPTPRLFEGQLISAYAGACIDISDGLLADAVHIAESSACGLRIELDALPLSEALREFSGDRASLLALTAGDDYELLFSVSENAWKALEAKAGANVFTKIGRVEPESFGVRVFSANQEVNIQRKGFQHFE